MQRHIALLAAFAAVPRGAARHGASMHLRDETRRLHWPESGPGALPFCTPPTSRPAFSGPGWLAGGGSGGAKLKRGNGRFRAHPDAKPRPKGAIRYCAKRGRVERPPGPPTDASPGPRAEDLTGPRLRGEPESARDWRMVRPLFGDLCGRSSWCRPAWCLSAPLGRDWASPLARPEGQRVTRCRLVFEMSALECTWCESCAQVYA